MFDHDKFIEETSKKIKESHERTSQMQRLFGIMIGIGIIGIIGSLGFLIFIIWILARVAIKYL